MSDDYVTNAAWLQTSGRPDAVDEIADQFERPSAAASPAIWVDEPVVRWPSASRGWRSADRLHAPLPESKAG